MSLDKIKQVATNAAKEAGELAKRMQKNKQVQLKKDNPVDLVTDADHASQELIINKIKAAFPDHNIIGEEDASEDNGGEYTWIIDPIDGTTNYARGLPSWCVSIGVEHRSKAVVGVVYSPILNELFIAAKGQGATLNGESISVSEKSTLLSSVICTGFPYHKNGHADDNVKEFCKVIKEVGGFRRCGSAALDMCFVAAGRYDGYWEQNLGPWDCAAGEIIVQEAGGNFEKQWFTNALDEERLYVIATNGLIHPQLKELVWR